MLRPVDSLLALLLLLHLLFVHIFACSTYPNRSLGLDEMLAIRQSFCCTFYTTGLLHHWTRTSSVQIPMRRCDRVRTLPWDTTQRRYSFHAAHQKTTKALAAMAAKEEIATLCIRSTKCEASAQFSRSGLGLVCSRGLKGRNLVLGGTYLWQLVGLLFEVLLLPFTNLHNKRSTSPGYTPNCDCDLLAS